MIRKGLKISLSSALLLLCVAFTSFSISSCNNSDTKGQISSDVVDNPVSAEGDQGKDLLPVMTFDTYTHDFGKVIQGEVISYAFHLTNTGKGPLVIADVTTSCGCTVADYPKDALAPGEDGYISVKFDSKGRRGFQSKLVTVVANTVPNTVPLKINADIVIPEE